MKVQQIIFRTSVVALSILLAACTSTKFISVWKDDTYKGKPARIMIVAESNMPELRRMLEEEFVKALKKHETDAISSYALLPDLSLTEMGAIYARAREVGADAVLATRFIGRMVKTSETSESVWTTHEDQYIDTTTEIYDMKSGKKIWTASSETRRKMNISDNAQIQSFVKAIIQKLSAQKLISPTTASNIKSF